MFPLSKICEIGVKAGLVGVGVGTAWNGLQIARGGTPLANIVEYALVPELLGQDMKDANSTMLKAQSDAANKFKMPTDIEDVQPK